MASLPQETRVGAVTLQVADLERSRDFYHRILGLTEPLIHLVEHSGATPAPRKGRFGLFHFAVLLPGRTALASFAAHLIKSGIPFGMADHTVSEAFYFSDPDGLGIEVYADRPRERWTKMTTEPLDIGDLLQYSQPWRGAPPETTIGHMHLHVGDLQQARDFYSGQIGFDVTYDNYPGALFLSAGGYHHHLGVNTWSRGPAPEPDEAQLREWELLIPGLSESRTLADPWGTRVTLRSL